MLIAINDDFNLKRIADSGQCFRVKDMGDGVFRFVTGSNVLYIRRVCDGAGNNSIVDAAYEISCTQQVWNEIWMPYFDMDRNYSGIRASIPSEDSYMCDAANCGEGIRILKQDPWEMLISFIISQRKSIPAIKTSIEMLCERYGSRIECENPFKYPALGGNAETCKDNGGQNVSYLTAADNCEAIYTFPTAESIMANPDLLSECKLGYRLKYIEDAARRVAYKEMNLEAMQELDSQELLLNLKEVYGVGDKVANCIALFAYGRCELAPVDTWIRKVIDNIYGGANPFPGYGDVAGIMQQYIFYYALTHKTEF